MGGFLLWHHIFWYWSNCGWYGDPGGLERFPGHPWQCGSEVVPVLPLAHFDFHQGGKVPTDVGPRQSQWRLTVFREIPNCRATAFFPCPWRFNTCMACHSSMLITLLTSDAYTGIGLSREGSIFNGDWGSVFSVDLHWAEAKMTRARCASRGSVVPPLNQYSGLV
jgi:hypothetical protein